MRIMPGTQHSKSREIDGCTGVLLTWYVDKSTSDSPLIDSIGFVEQ